MSVLAQDLLVVQLHESPWNPRKHFPQKSLGELADSIRKVGILSPILVRPAKKTNARADEGYEIAAGHRRYRAARLAKLEAVPCIVKDLDDQQFLEILTIENLQREDVHPLDEGEGFRTLMEQTGWDADQVAGKVGKSKSYVYQRLKLAELIGPVKEAFLSDKITASHAILIARERPEQQREALKACVARWGDEELVGTRELARWIDGNLHLKLAAAPWKKDDETLVPKAGACNVCPKRSGYAPELFPEIKGNQEVCLDRACYQAKQQAHIQRLQSQAKASGGGLLKLDDVSFGTRAAGVLKAHSQWREVKPGSCSHATKGVVIRGTRIGEVLTICAEKTCKQHLAKYLSVDDGRWRKERAREKEKHARELDRRRRILVAIRERVKGTLNRADLERVAVEYFCDLWSDLRTPVLKIEGWLPEGKAKRNAYRDTEQLAKQRIPKLKDVELGRFLVTLSLIKGVELPYSKADSILLAAKRWNVNVTAIDKQLQAEAAERAAKVKARGKKAKRRGSGAVTIYPEPTCTRCGCTETTACQTEVGACSWVKLDKKTNAGLCSACAPAGKAKSARTSVQAPAPAGK